MRREHLLDLGFRTGGDVREDDVLVCRQHEIADIEVGDLAKRRA